MEPNLVEAAAPPPPVPIRELRAEEWVREQVGEIRRNKAGSLMTGEGMRIAEAIMEANAPPAGKRTVTTRQFALIAYGEDTERARTSASGTMGKLVKDGKLRRVKSGVYARGSGEPAAPEKRRASKQTVATPQAGDLLEVVGLWGRNVVMRDMDSKTIHVFVVRPAHTGGNG